MTKRILSIVAAAAILTTGAMAYDSMGSMEFNTSVSVAETGPMQVNPAGFGQSLIFPAYFVGGGWQTTLRVINTGDTATVAKVVLYAANDSHEVKDFNIYLSAHDEWVGTIKIDPTDNKAKIISSDDSAPLTTGGMATNTKPMVSSAFTSNKDNSGYVEVIGCASTVGTAHGKHIQLRQAYQNLATADRNITNVGGGKVRTFKNGVLYVNATTGIGTKGYVPNVALATRADANDTNNSASFTFTAPQNTLIGDVRITNTQNGTDMDMPAVALSGVLATGHALLYVEGEAANVLDRDIDSNTTKISGNNYYPDYNATKLTADSSIFNNKKIYMPYSATTINGTTSQKQNQLVITNPFKRIALMNGVDGSYKDINATAGTGYLQVTPDIYNMSEKLYTPSSTTEFSPATTTGAPIMKLYSEVAGTESTSGASTDHLSTYLDAASGQDSSFSKGYVILHNVNSNDNISGIATQMMATQPTSGGNVVTNWVPAHATAPAAK